MVAGATCLVTGASGVTLGSSVHFPGEFFITAGAFAPGHVLNFGNLSYITDNYGKLCSLIRATSAGNEPLALPPPPGLLGADVEVLAQ
jgi:hypothetical protein